MPTHSFNEISLKNADRQLGAPLPNTQLHAVDLPFDGLESSSLLALKFHARMLPDNNAC